jgi:hypothetical protein
MTENDTYTHHEYLSGTLCCAVGRQQPHPARLTLHSCRDSLAARGRPCEEMASYTLQLPHR